MSNIYGVVLKKNGKVYLFNGNDLEIENGERVIIETEKGIQLGQVTKKIDEHDSKISPSDMKKIIEVATDKDYDTYLQNLKDAEKAANNARKFAEELNLNMRVIDASYTLDRKQLLINFISDERVDFRDLAKKLAGIYKTRIELRQIGARDKARNVSGLGLCGRPLCCSSFLTHIDSVSMNMAKNQNLSLNPTKINGLCDRLLCCLTYEDEEYSRCQKGMPSVGQTIKTSEGTGKVVSVDILNRKYKIDVDGVVKEISLPDGICKK